MPSLPPIAFTDIDTLPDGAVITDEEIDASASGEASSVFQSFNGAPPTIGDLPTRPRSSSFDEETTRKALTPRAVRGIERDDDTANPIDLSSWHSRSGEGEAV